MLYKNDIIANFPENFSWIRKILANVWYKFGSIMIHKRENNLSIQDKRNTRKEIQPGDVILTGALRRMHSLYIGSVFTHALIYLGSEICIHAVAQGVGTISLHDVLDEYDTIMILRHKKNNKEKIKTMIEYAKQQIGKPFDFTFENDEKKLYCTELLYHAFTKGHMDMSIKENGENIHLIGRRAKEKEILHPMDLLKGSFEVIFKSHNLKQTEEGIIYTPKNRLHGLYWIWIWTFKKVVEITKKIMHLRHYKN